MKEKGPQRRNPQFYEKLKFLPCDSKVSSEMNEPFTFEFDSVVKQKLHIRVQQRNGKKSITTVEGFDDDLDVKRICKAMRKVFSCNGNVVEDKEKGMDILQLQGDQRDNVKEWVLAQQIISKSEADRIVVHGF